MPASFRRLAPSPRPLVVALILATSGLATEGLVGTAAAQPAEPETWALCRKNALLDFFVPGLGTEAERATADTAMDADAITVTGKKDYLLEGGAVVTRADQRIAADSLRYDAESQQGQAQGQVRFQDSTVLIAADHAEVDLAKDTTLMTQVDYQLLAARGNGHADKARREGAAKTYLDTVSFSTCDPGQHDWEITARDMELNHETGEGKAHGMRLRFKNHTLLALPYASFPIDDRRRSGFLYPSIGGSSNGSLDLLIPYYLNLAPNYDATITPRIIGDRGLMLGGEFRYLTTNHRGEFAGSYMPNDRDADRSRHSYQFKHWGALNRYFFVNADIRRVSDDRYFEDFGDSLSSSATRVLSSNAYLNGRGEWWTLAFGGDNYEVTDPELPPSAEPYERLPRLAFDAERRFNGPIALGLRSELVRFQKSDAIEGSRYDFNPYVAFPIERAAWFIRPELGTRYTRYDLNGGADRSPTRTTSIASLDAGMYFDRDVSWFGSRLRQTLEPRLYYLRVPYRDQSDLPVFDTQELTFSFAQLFRPNRFSGADRQMDANNVTLAVTSRLLADDSGEEIVRASFGQIRYLDDQRVQLPGVISTDYSGSDYAAEFDFRLNRRWRLALSQLYDPNNDRTDLSAIRVQRQFAEGGVANFSYRFRRDQLEQVDASTAYPLNERWRLIGRWNYSLRDSRTLEALAGLEFDSCCYAFRILGRHYVRNVEGESSNGLYFELELKGLGAFGQRTEDFLRRAILGYR